MAKDLVKYSKLGAAKSKARTAWKGFARGAGKLALRFPGTGLAATAAYYGAKHVVKKGERMAARSATKQWHKRDKFGRTRWYL